MYVTLYSIFRLRRDVARYYYIFSRADCGDILNVQDQKSAYRTPLTAHDNFVLLKTKKHPNNLDPKTQAKETNSIFSLEFPEKKKKKCGIFGH